MESISLKDFIPVSSWKVDQKICYSNKKPMYAVDSFSKRSYLNESSNTVRFKCLLLSVGTPFIRGGVTLIDVAMRIVFCVTGYRFFEKHYCAHNSYNLSLRFRNVLKDVRSIVVQPLCLMGMQFSAIYGLLTPYNGRKLYASFERSARKTMNHDQHNYFANFFLAPCFQPKASYHFFGGNIHEQNAY